MNPTKSCTETSSRKETVAGMAVNTEEAVVMHAVSILERKRMIRAKASELTLSDYMENEIKEGPLTYHIACINNRRTSRLIREIFKR